MPTTFATLSDNPTMDRAGFRFGPRGTQGSRTIMLRELTELFVALPPDATRDDYTTAIVQENALGKRTYATRLSSRQRLTEMYGLDPTLAVFRVLRHLWRIDPPASPCSPCSVRSPVTLCFARPPSRCWPSLPAKN